MRQLMYKRFPGKVELYVGLCELNVWGCFKDQGNIEVRLGSVEIILSTSIKKNGANHHGKFEQVE